MIVPRVVSISVSITYIKSIPEALTIGFLVSLIYLASSPERSCANLIFAGLLYLRFLTKLPEPAAVTLRAGGLVYAADSRRVE